MAKVQILYWQDIPSVVEAREGREGLSGSDAYLEQWAKGSPEVRDGDARTVAEVVAGEIEAKYEAIRSAQLAAINPSAE
jgi:hypothetical protein